MPKTTTNMMDAAFQVTAQDAIRLRPPSFISSGSGLSLLSARRSLMFATGKISPDPVTAFLGVVPGEVAECCPVRCPHCWPGPVRLLLHTGAGSDM